MTEHIESLLIESRYVLTAFINDEQQMRNIQSASEVMVECLRNGNKIIACGNGGSMSDAIHFCAELTGKFKKDRHALPAMVACDPAYLSAVGNDYGYQKVFARYVEAFGKHDDVFVAISTSGQSHNVIAALWRALEQGMKIIVLTGEGDMPLPAGFDTVCLQIQVPSTDTRLIQEVHIKVLHVLVMLIEKALFPEL